jgi:hypothetical protein
MLLSRVSTTCLEGDLYIESAFPCSIFNGSDTTQNDEIRNRNFPGSVSRIERSLDAFHHTKNLCQFRRVVDFPEFLRCQTYPCTIGTTPLI